MKWPRNPRASSDLLRLSMTLAHNRGDLTQGMGFWRRTSTTAPLMDHLLRARPLCARRPDLSTYRPCRRRPPPLSAAFRESPASFARDFIAPLPVPRRLGRRCGATRREPQLAAFYGGRHAKLLVRVTHRAIAGMLAASTAAFERAAAHMPNAAGACLGDAENKPTAVLRISFKSM